MSSLSIGGFVISEQTIITIWSYCAMLLYSCYYAFCNDLSAFVELENVILAFGIFVISHLGAEI